MTAILPVEKSKCREGDIVDLQFFFILHNRTFLFMAGLYSPLHLRAPSRFSNSRLCPVCSSNLLLYFDSVECYRMNFLRKKNKANFHFSVDKV